MDRLPALSTACLLLAALGALVACPAAAQSDDGANATNTTVIDVAVPQEDLNRTGRVLTARVARTPWMNGTVEPIAGGVRVRLTPAAQPSVVDQLTQPGNVTVQAQAPDAGRTLLFDNRGVDRVGSLQSQSGVSYVPVTLTAAGAGRFSAVLSRLNVTANPASCDVANGTGYCLFVTLDGETVSTAGVTGPLAAAVEDGSFNESRSFSLTAGSFDSLTDLRVALAGPALPESASVAAVRNVSTGTAPPPATDPEPTATPTATATPDPTTTTGGGTPGFAPATLLAAVLALLALAHRVRN
jgi:hypothetical protein